MSEEYYEGMNCKCMARSEAECACNWVDWTPKEVYELRKKVAELEAFNQELRQRNIGFSKTIKDLREQIRKKARDGDV